MLEFLWRAGRRTKDARYFALVELSLARMCEGGIYDHLGGGLARYSVDERWLVPHFEKMLYDNALLLPLLALAYQRSGNTLFRTRAEETVDWLAREMTTPEGAFCASLDADSEGEEGKFYVWTPAEIGAVLGQEDASFFAEHYDVTESGNFEGHNILNRLKSLPRSIEDEQRLAQMRQKLLEVRGRRVRPGLDDKVLADWNGLLIEGLVSAARLFERNGWIEKAARAFLFIAAHMSHGNRLGHSWRAGKLLFPGLASDHAAMTAAALALYEATQEREYLERAETWQATLDRHYANKETGGYYLAADDAVDLVVRPSPTTDDAIPNAIAIVARNLVRLAIFTGHHDWRDQADRLFEGVLSRAGENLFGHLALLNALDFRLRAAEIVVTGSDRQATELLAAARKFPFLDTVVLPASDALPKAHPAQEKIKASAESAAFVCVGETCSLPVMSLQALAAALDATRR
jgi:uncharacterized protein YyaL (SSP411 family)